MQDWYKPSNPDKVKPFPWLAPKVIKKLESLLTPDMEVLEHGSGGSTLWFAERVKFVLAIEQDLDWRRVIEKKLGKNRGAICASLGDIIPSQRLLNGRFDLLLIDGEPVEDRIRWLIAANNLVKAGGWVVLDNCNRPEYEKEFEALKARAVKVEILEGNVYPCKYLVTAFLRMP
jgi:predicted O-methyltransferase YrrM